MSAFPQIFGLYLIVTSVIIIFNKLMICYFKKSENVSKVNENLSKQRPVKDINVILLHEDCDFDTLLYFVRSSNKLPTGQGIYEDTQYREERYFAMTRKIDPL